MTNKQTYARELKAKAKRLEREDYFSSLLTANFGSLEHNMLIGEKDFRDFYSSFPEELIAETSTFEKVELIDYWNFVDGRTDKKR